MKKIPITALVSLAWFLLVSLAYVYTHKAFSAEILIALGSLGWKMLLALAVISLAGGAGQKLATRLGIESAPVALAIGLGIFSLGLLTWGSFIGIQAWAWAILVVGTLAWLWRDILLFWRSVWEAGQALVPSQLLDKTISIFSLLILFLNLPVAAAPPLAFDALVYHLTLPLRYLQVGRIVHIADSMFSGMPQLAEMNYLFALVMGGEAAPAVLGWFLAALTLLFIGQAAARQFGPRLGWFAIAALLSGFSISRLSGQAYIEWFLLFYGFAWWVALARAIEEKGEGRWLFALGVVSGFALSLKYTAGVLILLTGLALVLHKQGWRSKIRSLLLFGLIASLVSLPWWIKNFAWTGNPFYPLLFASAEMDEIRLRAFHGVPSALSLVDIFTFPWYITIWGIEGKVGPSASIGPLLLAFAPLAYAHWRQKSRQDQSFIRLLSIILLSGFLIWYLAGLQNGLLLQTRLFVTLFPAWVLLASAGFSTLTSLRMSSVRLERIGLAVTLMFLGFNLLETVSDTLPRRAIEANFGLLSRDSYLKHNLGDLQLANQAIQALGPQAKVLMLWETRSFYCAPHCDPDEIIDRWYHETRLHASAPEILASWQAQGYTHLLIYDLGLEFVRNFDNAKYNPTDWVLLDQLRQALGEGQKIGAYTLYTFKP